MIKTKRRNRNAKKYLEVIGCDPEINCPSESIPLVIKSSPVLYLWRKLQYRSGMNRFYDLQIVPGNIGQSKQG